ncbi:MAG: hypothetical protein IIB38_10710, partial [Candidatus Hydrogenedentes bacterium]|nr:hypothetical protein [Candidatus Hydrogenedentota bacterium]
PICFAEERHRKNFYNFQQLPYDHHEWDYQSWMWTGLQPQRMKDGGLVPPFRIGPLARTCVHRYPGISRRYAEHPLLGRMGMATQRTLAKTAQWLNGKPKLYRDEAIVRAAQDASYLHVSACEGCTAKDICDGFHGDYVTLFGAEEANPIEGAQRIADPLHYARHQEKLVEPEDRSWAL